MNKQDQIAAMLKGEKNIWPDGWYLFEDGQVRGPLNANEAFDAKTIKDKKGKPRLISRKGFSQWYPVQDFAEIYRLSAEVGSEADHEVKKLQKQLETFKRQMTNPSGNPAKSLAKKVLQKTMEPMSFHKTSDTMLSQAPSSMVKPISGHKTGAVSMGEPLESAFGSDTGFDVSDHAKIAARTTDVGKAKTMAYVSSSPSGLHSIPGTQLPQSGAPQVLKEKQKAKGKAQSNKATKARSLMFHEYFLARGRMRLGKLRNPWVSALINIPLTLGAYWVVWFHETHRELKNHLENKKTANLPPFILSIVPGLHIYMTYRLAKLVNQMETENKYSNTSPFTAALFAILPPLAVIYLQDAMNQHWWLHVKHEMMKKQKKGQLTY